MFYCKFVVKRSVNTKKAASSLAPYCVKYRTLTCAFLFKLKHIIWNLRFKGTKCTVWLVILNFTVHDDITCLQCVHVVTSRNVAMESHELQELNCYCQQTKSSFSVGKKGVFSGTLEWILLPLRETNWTRQASLPEWRKLVCGSASAPSNKEKKSGWEQRMRQNECKSWHINGTSEAVGVNTHHKLL